MRHDDSFTRKTSAMLLIENPHKFLNNAKVPTVRPFYDKLFDAASEVCQFYSLKTGAIRKFGYFYRLLNFKLVTYHTAKTGRLNVKIGYLPNLFYFDRCGYSGWSEIAFTMPKRHSLSSVEIERLDQFKRQVKDKKITKYKEKQPSCASLKERTPGLVFFDQVPGDSVEKLHRFTSVEVIAYMKEVSKYTGLPIYYKPHPMSNGCANEILSDPEIHVTSASVDELMGKAKIVFVKNSGCGFEALLRGKRVFTFGYSDYEQVCGSIYDIGDVPRMKSLVREDFHPSSQVDPFLYEYIFELMVNIDQCEKEKIKERLIRLLS